MFDRIREDIVTAKGTDPAAPTTATVFFCYSGLHALWAHRWEHWLWNHHCHGYARWHSGMARFFTGVEIHPAAQIGHRVFIDHGMGVVIGETTIMGDDCTLYQGCTLGGTGKETGKRHPTLGNNVTVGVGAAVLGSVVIGDNTKIGGGAVVVDDVPADCTVVGIPGRVVWQAGYRVGYADVQAPARHEMLPDPVFALIEQMQQRIDLLDRRVSHLQSCLGRVPLSPSELESVAAVLVRDEEGGNPSLAAQVLFDGNEIRIATESEEFAKEMHLGESEDESTR
jgi:serine O-acetyltransferase